MQKYVIWFLILPPSHTPLSEYENVAPLAMQATKALEPSTTCYRLQPSKTYHFSWKKVSSIPHIG